MIYGHNSRTWRYVLGDDGQPIAEPDLMTWARWMEDPTRSFVARTTCGDADVSTIFLGIDYDHSFTGEPILFETMIFGGSYDMYSYRWHTRTEAEAGHVRIVAALREGRKPEGEASES